MPLHDAVAPDVLPPEARRLYELLPSSFTFTGYFGIAEEHGFQGPVAKDYLRLFLKEKVLLQTGTRIEKHTRPSSAARSFRG